MPGSGAAAALKWRRVMKRAWNHGFVNGLFLAALSAAPAAAQTGAPSTPPGTQTCADAANQLRPRGDRTPQLQDQPGASLSDKLARSHGIICPPGGGDPEIRAPTPHTGDTPAITPPGRPGGRPDIRPTSRDR